MIDTLGYPLAVAKQRLTEAGYAVNTVETRSRKGVEGGEARVLRQTAVEDGTVTLTYAYCITAPKE